MAEMTTAEMDALPDSCFAYIEPGGKKVDGKTEPRSKRHLPFKRADGSIDLAHLRNALARLDQTQAVGLDAEKKKQIRAHLERLLETANADKSNSLTTALDIAAILGASPGASNAAGAVAADSSSPAEAAELRRADPPVEGWYQVDLQGRWEGHPAGAYRLTPADIRCIVSYFNSACRANGVELPVDYEHQGVVAKLLGKSAESGGWINALEARNGDTELWAHIRWVDDAQALIRAKKFRYLSSHLMRNYADPVTGKLIPWVLDSVALTNRPFKKALPAVANSDAAAAGFEEGRTGAPDSAVAAEEEDGAMQNLLTLLAAAMSLDAKAVANSLGVAEDAKADVVVKAVAGMLTAADQAAKRLKVFVHALGVAEDADEEAIQAALGKLKAGPDGATTSEAEMKLLSICNALGATPDQPLDELLALIGSTRAIRAQSAAEKLVENAISVERKITPANREAFIRLAMQDFEGARKILNSMPPVLGGATNAAGAQAASETPGLSDADRWACEQTGLKEAEFLKTKKAMLAAP
jgi:phage I-like protein